METILNLIAKYGVEGAQKIYEIVSKRMEANKAPSAEMWTELREAENLSNAEFKKTLGADV